MNEPLIWFLAGLVPYYIKWVRLARGGRKLEVRALFWTLKIEHGPDGGGWTLRVPLIERLKGAIWAAVMHLRNDPPDEVDDNADPRQSEENGAG
jgi:hypothetical protein